MSLDLEKKASSVGPKINIAKTKVYSPTGRSTLPICIIGQNIEDIDQFLYLGYVVSTDGSIELDIARRTRSTFAGNVVILTPALS